MLIYKEYTNIQDNTRISKIIVTNTLFYIWKCDYNLKCMTNKISTLKCGITANAMMNKN